MGKLVNLNSLNSIDFIERGLICGLEIHQQLNCGKLFCSCPCLIEKNEELEKNVERRLRFSQSENGDIDKAALDEFLKGKYNIYKYNNEIACLVDLDEEPPNGPRKEALDTAVRIGLMMNISFFDKIQFMRKLIIDGSVTAGFQRTAMLGFGGYIETAEGRVRIDGINLEEDSCRAIARNDNHNIFSLDRQGIPLIEITTGPDIKTPKQMQDTAKQIGNILRSFKETRRGLGTIRQDLNVSIRGGARIEIKGAQNLKLIADVVESEVKRQIIHISVVDELKSRGINFDNFSDFEIYDVSNIFKKTNSKVILDNLTYSNSKVFAIKLNKFKGILGHEVQIGYRFATEISDRNKLRFHQVKGLFHSDELPKYGITEMEVFAVREELNLNDDDSFILIANDMKIANASLKYVLEIIKELIQGVPSEVRQVDPKGILTKFLRTMPGGARMYPETDIREIILDNKYFDEMKKQIPELYDERIERISKNVGLDEIKTGQVLDRFDEDQVMELMRISGIKAANLFSILFDLPKDIKKRDNIEVYDFKYNLLLDILKYSSQNSLNQNIIRDIFVSLYKDKLDEVENFKEYLEKKGFILEDIDDLKIENTIKEIVQRNKGAPFGALMGIAMKEFSGKVDGKKISDILKKFF